jgi:hypothetical protein
VNIMGRQRYLRAAALAACAMLTLSCLAQDAASERQTERQTQRTDQANRDATVADEASTAQPARAAPAPSLSYGPVLNPRSQQGADTVRKDPAEVRDETDTLARQPDQQPTDRQLTDKQLTDKQLTDKQLTDKQREELRRRAARRHQAWQGEGPMAPRPLRAGATPPATAAVPIPPPLPAPQPSVPSSTVIRACQGIVCTDAAGNTFNGSGNAGSSSNGRACARTGTTVQCF